MITWQIDFYRRPLKNKAGKPIWELLICSPDGNFIYDAQCSQSQANSDWLVEQLQTAAKGNLPNLIQVFRPQSLSLLKAAGEKLAIEVEATRRVAALKTQLSKRASEYANLDNSTGEVYQPIKIEQPPPQALPENLWGDEWRFAAIPAGEIEAKFKSYPIPIVDLPDALLPLNLGIASTVKIPGVIIYGGRKSMQLACWLAEAKPFALNYIPTVVGESGGLVLETGLCDRWIVATFEDAEVAKAAQFYQQRQQASQGLHFLLVQPDDSGMTYTAFWLLQNE
ncbi:MAG: Tab2/Atab2 family RNA-binding protein [Oscillatoria sp. PMC 1051.18]|nr:Tab2/Atab2 family RNA-binding protein [Oscillatoria sp. PMC 1050.18]MEC5030427.1 Tab2/Atab2 family RNA-binding protein [Oscillatoria sp. PMC 1051.18]